VALRISGPVTRKSFLLLLTLAIKAKTIAVRPTTAPVKKRSFSRKA
jgi:hypothetical protein